LPTFLAYEYFIIYGDQFHYSLHIVILHAFLTDVTLSPSAQIGANSVVGSVTSIAGHCKVLNSVIGQGCKIGKNVLINGSFIWDNVIIEDGCKVSNSLVCDGVHLRAGAVVEPGCVLSFKVHCNSIDITTSEAFLVFEKYIICFLILYSFCVGYILNCFTIQVEVGKNVVVPAHSKVSLLPQPSNEDSDEELEYADTNSGIADSPRKSADPKNLFDFYVGRLILFLWPCNLHVLLGELVSSLQHFLV
jgi:translation initiation factor eIF-2B subunit epsilon